MAFSATDEDPPDRDRLKWSVEGCSNVLGGSVRFIGSASCGDTQISANIGVEFSRDAPPRPGDSFRLKVTGDLADPRIMVSLEPEPEQSKRLRARVYLGGAVRQTCCAVLVPEAPESRPAVRESRTLRLFQFKRG